MSQPKNNIKSVTLFGRKITICIVSESKLRKVSESKPDETVYGYYEDISRTVYLNETLQPEQLRTVLLHELMHAILSIGGVSNILSEKVEESICNATEAFIDLFNDSNFLGFICNKSYNK